MTFRLCTFSSSNFCKILKSHFSIDANVELSKDGQNLANAALKCMDGDSHVLYSSSDSNIKQNLSVTSHINCIAARCLIKMVYLTA